MRDRNAREDEIEHAKQAMLVGALWAGGGLGVSYWTWQQANEHGGSYALFYGAIAFGLVKFVRGLSAYLDLKNGR